MLKIFLSRILKAFMVIIKQILALIEKQNSKGNNKTITRAENQYFKYEDQTTSNFNGENK